MLFCALLVALFCSLFWVCFPSNSLPETIPAVGALNAPGLLHPAAAVCTQKPTFAPKTPPPPKVEVLRHGRFMRLPSPALVPGDVVAVAPGVLSCDCVLLRGEVIVDENMLTGESVPVRKVGRPHWGRADGGAGAPRRRAFGGRRRGHPGGNATGKPRVGRRQTKPHQPNQQSQKKHEYKTKNKQAKAKLTDNKQQTANSKHTTSQNKPHPCRWPTTPPATASTTAPTAPPPAPFTAAPTSRRRARQRGRPRWLWSCGRGSTRQRGSC